jgi:hypothetical protein
MHTSPIHPGQSKGEQNITILNINSEYNWSKSGLTGVFISTHIQFYYLWHFFPLWRGHCL